MTMERTSTPDPVFFSSVRAFRSWLAKNHATHSELWLGMYKKASGKSGITYKEALDEALCYGWIDGVRKSLDGDSFVQRFTPRKAKSYWSAVNTRRANELIAEKRMAPPGLKAFEARDRELTARYSFEREEPSFDASQLKAFKANRKAWEFFEEQPPGYRRLATFYVTSAKKPETRAQRLDRVISTSAARKRIL
jgi:uncharacterized protein YdeI (YjbR/CyaY-like superfamily)